MIEKFESLREVEELGEVSEKFIECEKKTATHVHKCYHDEENPRPCTRRKL